MYGPLVCAEQPQSFCQVMNSINTVGYWKRPGHTRSHLNSSFPFSPFSIFVTSQINCIVFLFVLSFLSSSPCPSIYRPHSFCATFNELKGMQECTGNTWQSTSERLRLTNGTAASRWLCLLFFLCIRPPEQEAAGMSIAIEARLESDVNWTGDWFVGWKCLKMENGVEAEGRPGDRWTMREKVTNKKPVWEESSAAAGLEDHNDWAARCADICIDNNFIIPPDFLLATSFSHVILRNGIFCLRVPSGCF